MVGGRKEAGQMRNQREGTGIKDVFEWILCERKNWGRNKKRERIGWMRMLKLEIPLGRSVWMGKGSYWRKKVPGLMRREKLVQKSPNLRRVGRRCSYHSLNLSLGHSHLPTPLLLANTGKTNGKPLYLTSCSSWAIEREQGLQIKTLEKNNLSFCHLKIYLPSSFTSHASFSLCKKSSPWCFPSK